MTKSVLITGCSDDGIGSALAREFHEKGLLVFATARDTSKASKLQAAGVRLIELDVTNPGTISAAAEAVEKETGGKLDFLVNNAGHNHFMPTLDEDIEEVKKLFDTNVWGPMRVVKTFAPLVIKAKGTFVFVTSISGYLNIPFMGSYAASKRSIEIIAETLRLEMKPFGVGVLSVVNGAVQSQGQSYFQDWTLPSDSMYKPVEETIFGMANGGLGPQRPPTDKHAEAVVKDITDGKVGKVWHGANAERTRTYHEVDQDVRDGYAVRGTGIDALMAQQSNETAG